MRRSSCPLRTAIAAGVLALFAGCRGIRDDFAKGDLFTPDPDGPDTMSRTFECLQKDSEGNCVANKCTKSPEGEEYDCRTFAHACIDAGYHWDGTRDSGVCAAAL